MGELEKTPSIPLSEEKTNPETSVTAISEYDEYLGLCEIMTEDKMKKLVRKIDIYVLPQLIVLYLMSYIDRTNVGNAKLFGALQDMGLSGQDWNTALSVFFVTYALGAVPSNIMLQKFGPRIWLPTIMLAVSIILICCSLQSTMAGWTIFRVLLGLVEAGVFPGCSAVLTTWYSPHEVHTRMTIFYMGASAAGAFSGLLAYAIGQLDGTWGYRGWRWIFCLEGAFTALLSIAAFWIIHDTPSKVSWLTSEEKRFVLLRHKFAAGGESGIAEKEEFSWAAVSQSFHVYACVVMEFTLCVVVYGVSFVLPTIIKNLGYSAATAQAMTAPPYIFACLVTVFSGWAADRYKQRMLSVLLPNLLAMIGFVIIIVSVRYKELPGVTLFGIFFAIGGLYPISPAVTAWTALNLAGTMKRSVGIGAMIAFSQLGGIVGSNIYISTQSPRYPVGFGVSISMLGLCGIIWPACYFFILKRINATRAKISTEEVRAKYTDAELAEMGDESPLFRYST
ncbi:MFS general substrate transporter [Cucurbitaria berberidis CBS 394.84]|uniref:MFS general substrate transporter n=1 Tax=Cucurbitaria berberidis CBS 394.84 TaxID=1168544 RepID=A0A9P4GGC4_9PLEO|nr:MFS general substrate transporter [Cucurbitaria berberidis CBS 394.84]KAF1845055.1 MFS general substrate transporter [Cucurbitaria berberidis CBS 394.84]